MVSFSREPLCFIQVIVADINNVKGNDANYEVP